MAPISVFSFFDIALLFIAAAILFPVLTSKRGLVWVVKATGFLGLFGLGAFALYVIRSDSSNETATVVEVSMPSYVEVAPPTQIPLPPLSQPAKVKSESRLAAAEAAETKPAKIETSRKPATARPAWVDEKAGRSGGVYHRTLLIGPYTSRAECETSLPSDLAAAVADYVRNYLGPAAADSVRLPSDYIERNVLEEQWEEPIDSSVGPMIQLHARLKFDDDTRNEVGRLWRASEVRQRLKLTGGVAGGVLFLLATAFGYLKLDEATHGTRRRRLQAAAGGMILGVTLLAAMMARGVIGF